MTNQHTTRCFFGCNAGSGFHTFFNFLPRLERARIIIVKGGPGTGKSTFISAVGETFAQQGYDLEYQHCSLDPQSYDAVVVPALKAVVTAATGHHVFDPKNPGAVDEILNLGDHWDTERIRQHSKEIIEINQEAERLFRKAFRVLNAARQFLTNVEDIHIAHQDPRELSTVTECIIAEALLHSNSEMYGAERHAYISSNTPEGAIHNIASLLRPETTALAVKGEAGMGRTKILAGVAEKAKLLGFDVEYYHRPIDHYLLDHVHIPALNLLVTTQPDELPTQVIEESFTLQGKKTKRQTELQDEISENVTRYEQTLSLAMQTLAQIKAEHGVLEKYYIDSMDFDGVKNRLAATIESIERQATISEQAH